MLYILETKLSESKPVYIALTSIYGIGKPTSLKICKKLGFSLNLKIKNLTEEQTLEILKLIEYLNLITNNELKQFKSQTLKNLIEIKCYRGLRRHKGLPVRGQRTHTNAKSARKNKNY
jgi:small subunit ribosomal protein S13